MGLNPFEFSTAIQHNQFENLPKPFNDHNIFRIFNDEQYVNGKIERLFVLLKNYEAFYDVVRAELMVKLYKL